MSESNNTDAPLVQKIAGAFRDCEVLVTDPEILSNRGNLDYKSVAKDAFLTKEQRRYKRGKIIDIAHRFYKGNSEYFEGRDAAAPSLSAVADFFHIPRQSFSDHVKGNHVHGGAAGGPSRKVLISEETAQTLRDVVKHLRLNEDPRYDTSVLKSTDKELINLMALCMVKDDSARSAATFNQISEQLSLIDSKHHSEEVVHRRDVYGRLISFFQNPVLCTETFKLKSRDISEILAALLQIKTVYGAQDEVKKLSRRTICRARPKLGIVARNTKSQDFDEGTSVINDSMNMSIASSQLMESLADAAVSLDNRNILPPEGDDHEDATAEVSLDDRIRGLFRQLSAITDRPEDLSIDTFREYKRLVNELLTLPDAFGGYGPLIGEQIKTLTDIIFKLSFENTILMQRTGGQPMLAPTARMTAEQQTHEQTPEETHIHKKPKH